ncbi:MULTISPECIES: glycosyltransferase [Mesorhizobium]|uniref:glycosyltransferase n=1 Tax=Mesorhizobium TaxID=68287 RepID=UPI000FD5C9E3|nr:MULTISPECIES: glycosyltransferase [Mesorhizobium]RVC64651.1 glycosyltransferase family 4 protein [Mesorhizobium sp. M4B.F.Ca.ET.088.02.2.1]MDX8434627.1 glycosyltransferase [Mesorhizobium abyssinicae]RWA63041.1 MAG: glycosyltransferase family 4 protein [Mesorhizobium sp.]RWF34145.1 MAG: glycosyltransferase family 4 protein [Mesorhizobium sp.]RWF42891.1 MAG: glycosyltransferase family 4 protein [Mesorhizobium sp.]
MLHERSSDLAVAAKLDVSIEELPVAPELRVDRYARIAVVHDWCPNFRGGERVLAQICKQFPNAEVFTLFDFLPAEVKEQYFRDVEFHTSAANRLPMVQKFYRSLFFLCPFLIEQFDVTGYDAVISSSAAFSRGVITRPDQPHLCYVHSPVRYAWDEQFSYLQQGHLGFGPKGMLYRYMLHRLRTWDTRTAHGPDLMLANSNYVRSRIQHIYGRDARVVFPPVALAELPCVEDKDDYYVCASFLAPYKRTDLVIRAFNEMPSRRLVIVGEGQQSASLRALAGPNVTFSGYLPRQDYVDTLARAKAMVFAGCEDFGIALAEAQACGTPLIAFGRGGAVDIVQRLGASAEPTGVLFKAQTIEHLKEAVERFEENSHAIAPRACSMNAARFSEENFDRAILESLGAVQALHEIT